MLTQAKADELAAMPKRRKDDDIHDFPLNGQSLTVDLISVDGREVFILDISIEKKISLDARETNRKYQVRYQGEYILIRLDTRRPHTNLARSELSESEIERLEHLEPYFGMEFSGPHIHVYVEGYGDAWAMPIPVDRFTRLHEPYGTMDDFFAYCNIMEPPRIKRGLLP
jgi:hypothetical protein